MKKLLLLSIISISISCKDTRIADYKRYKYARAQYDTCTKKAIQYFIEASQAADDRNQAESLSKLRQADSLTFVAHCWDDTLKFYEEKYK